MSRIRVFLLCAVAAILACAPSLQSQKTAMVPSRIVAPVDESSLVTLKGSVSGRARAEFDKGRAQASAPITSMRLVLQRSPEREAALKQFMAEQTTPGSPNYHHWLTPQEFGELYGPSDADIQTLVTWLQGQGFTVQPVAPGRIGITFSGSVAQVEAAFHTEVHSYNTGRDEFLANATAPKIPMALAPVVTGLVLPDSIRPRPHSVGGGMGTFDRNSKRFRPAAELAETDRPAPFLSPGGTAALYVTASDGATIYNTPNSLNANFSGSSSFNGSGVTIGIGGDATIQASTFTSYRKRFVGDSAVPIITNVSTAPATSTDDSDEAYIDVELAGGLAPGATIHFYTSSDLTTAIEQAATDNTVDIFSFSFGECEMDMGNSGNQYIYQLWQQFAAQGIAVTVSTGDSGSAGCDNFNTQQVAQEGLQVSGFSSTPYNIAVGGTDYWPLSSSEFGNYVGSTNSSLYRSALSYIPESTWNDSTNLNDVIALNTPYLSTAGKGNIVAGSGGKSSCSTSTSKTTNGVTTVSCTAGYPKPSWQTGSGVPADGVRDVPDVSLFAGNGADTASWLICTDDTGTISGVKVTANCADTTISGQTTFVFGGFGGTSAATPAFAGMLALAEQQAGGRFGKEVVGRLYGLYNSTHNADVFHDVAQSGGNNSVPCAAGTPNCAVNQAGYNFLTDYDTGQGYDLATGLGSVNVTNLLQYWNDEVGNAVSTVKVTPSATSIQTTQSLSVPVTVAGNSGTPTGTVELTSMNYDSGPRTLVNGTYTFNIPAFTLFASTDTLTVAYSGDTTYAQSSGTGTVTVTEAGTTLAATPASTSITTDQALNINITLALTDTSITNAPAPTGSITVNGGGYYGYVDVTQFGNYTFTVPANSLTPGTDALTVLYQGDFTYDHSQQVVTVTVAKGAAHDPTIAITPSQTTLTVGDVLTVPVTVSGSNGTPTGNVTLTSGSYNSGPQSLISGATTFTIGPGSFPAGTNTLTVSYAGDNTYSAKTGTATVTLSKVTPSIVVTADSTVAVTTNPLNVKVSISSASNLGMPSGQVTLSSGNYSATEAVASPTNFTIPANALTPGTATLTATYSGDQYLNTVTGTLSIPVTAPTFSIGKQDPNPVNAELGSTQTSTTGAISIVTNTGYAGTVTLACTLKSSPANAQHIPDCTITGSPATLTASAANMNATANATAKFTVIPATTSTVAGTQVQSNGWKTGAASLLALLVFLGIPARRKAWRALLGVIVLMVAFGAMSACGGSSSGGGGGGGGGGGSQAVPGTTPGTYVFTITGTGNPDVSPAPTADVNLQVN